MKDALARYAKQRADASSRPATPRVPRPRAAAPDAADQQPRQPQPQAPIPAARPTRASTTPARPAASAPATRAPTATTSRTTRAEAMPPARTSGRAPSQGAARPLRDEHPAAPATMPAEPAASPTRGRVPSRPPQRVQRGPLTPPRLAASPALPTPTAPPAADAHPARPVTPPADALDSDRILELPTNRSGARGIRRTTAPGPAPQAAPQEPAPRQPLVRPARQRTGAAIGSADAAGGVQSLGDALQGYVAVLAERRRRRAALRDGTEADTPAGGPLKQTHEEACPHCGGAGWLRLDVPFGDPRFGQPVPCQCKEREIEERHRREEERRLAELDRFFSLRPFADKTFDTFDPRVPGLREAYVVAQTYAEDPQGWLLLMGGYGTGKTHLAAAIAHERLAAGSSVYFAVVPELLDHLRAAFAPGSEVTYDEMFDKIREVELLVLDDLGAENGTAWATEKLFQLINYRYNYRMPTVITTNNQLHSRMDDRVRSRLTDLSLVQPVVINAKDYRPRNARGGMRG